MLPAMQSIVTVFRALIVTGVVAAFLGGGGTTWAADAAGDPQAKKPKAKPLTPGGKYPAGDMSRPRPKVIEPGTASTPDQAGRPPSDAIVLFDGTDLSRWQTQTKGGGTEARWKIENGYMEIVPKSGAIVTKDEFGDCQLHLEWAAPAEVKGSGQGRGNSGIYIFGFGEIQVLDSYNNDTYPDGQAGALYNRYPPLVNASRKPGEWQSFDIILHTAKRDANGQVANPARLTVLHNGVVIHHAIELRQQHAQGRLLLQDHANPVRYRNIWVRELKDYDAE